MQASPSKPLEHERTVPETMRGCLLSLTAAFFLHKVQSIAAAAGGGALASEQLLPCWSLPAVLLQVLTSAIGMPDDICTFRAQPYLRVVQVIATLHFDTPAFYHLASKILLYPSVRTGADAATAGTRQVMTRYCFKLLLQLLSPLVSLLITGAVGLGWLYTRSAGLLEVLVSVGI
jgi:hypothetical protein